MATCEIPRKSSFVDIWKNSKKVKEAFEDAKKLVHKAVTLNYPRPNAPLAITTDASKVALGATLDQWVDGSWQPLGMWSKALKKPQQGYTTYKRELLAIKLAMRHFNKDFNGRRLCIFTDHRPLIGSFASPDLQPHDPQAVNAINEICQFTSDIRHKAGRDIPIADWLSRPNAQPLTSEAASLQKQKNFKNPDPGKFEFNFAPSNSKPNYVPPEATLAALQEVAIQTLNPDSLAEGQKSCPDVQAHLEGTMPANVKIGRVDMYGTELVCEVSDPENPRPMVPRSLKNLVINLLHHGDHPGVKETLRRVATDYYS